MAPHSSTLVWKIPWMEEPGGLQSMGSLELDMTERLQFHFSLSCIGEGNGNPLQCSCLENPRDGGAWWAAVYGVAQRQTRLKWFSSSKGRFRHWITSPNSLKFSNKQVQDPNWLQTLVCETSVVMWKQVSVCLCHLWLRFCSVPGMCNLDLRDYFILCHHRTREQLY